MIERIRQEVQQAMKSKDTLRLSTLRMMLAELTNKEKEHGQAVDQETAFKVFQTMLRKREDAIEQFQQAKRDDLAQKEKAEMVIIREFLPQPLSEEEIRQEVQRAIAEVDAKDMKSMGKVMGILTKKLAGKAQGGAMSKIVKEELSKL